MKSLSETINYKNQTVVNKFLMSFDIPESEAKKIFVEMLKWLWLCAKAHKDREDKFSGVPAVLNIQAGLIIIDEFWHIFLLHTRDYAAFCEEYLGMFVHHSPGSLDFESASKTDTERQMSYVYDHLGGAEILKRWYSDYSERYSIQAISGLRKDPLEYLTVTPEIASV